MKKQPEIIGFVGLGLIGGSIAKAVRHFYPQIHIVATSGHKETVDLALSENLIDEGCYEVGDAFSKCDYIFLCAPVSYNAKYLADLKPVIKKDCIITDVGSTKTDIHTKVTELGMEENFIGGHPMAGSEKTGLHNSKRHLIENAYYVVTPTEKVSKEAVEDYVEFIGSLKALPLVLDYKQHDYITAAISHLPHLIAAGLVNLVKHNDCEQQYMKTVAAGGFKDITRISSSSPVMWQNICLTNKDNILKLLEKYIDSLSEIKTQIAESSEKEIYNFFDTARNYRNSFIEANSGPIKKAYTLCMELADRTGALSEVVTLLAKENISIKNIGIIHNREYQSGAMHIEVYDNASLEKAKELLKKNEYVIYN